MECILCKGLVHHPMVDGNCGTTILCQICIEEWQADTENPDREKCPVCKEKLQIQELIPMMANVFNSKKLMVPKDQVTNMQSANNGT